MTTITVEQEAAVEASVLDTRGEDRYRLLRAGGSEHTFALWKALNDFRDRQKGLSWDAYASFEARMR